MSTNELNIDQKKRYAQALYLLYHTQAYICDENTGVGVSDNTLRKWIKEGKWDVLRATRAVSRKELKQRLYGLVDKLITNAIETESYENIGDELSKLRATIDKLGNEIGAEEAIEVSTLFINWMVSKMNIDRELTPDFIKKVTRYMNEFIKSIL